MQNLPYFLQQILLAKFTIETYLSRVDPFNRYRDSHITAVCQPHLQLQSSLIAFSEWSAFSPLTFSQWNVLKNMQLPGRGNPLKNYGLVVENPINYPNNVNKHYVKVTFVAV